MATSRFMAMMRTAVIVLAGVALPAIAAGSDRERSCWERRIAAAARVAAAAPGEVAFALIDPTGRAWQYRGRRTFPSASTLKTTVLLAYLRQPQVRGRALTKRERTLLSAMIRRSDNDATNALIGGLPRSAITAAAVASGQRDFRLQLPVWGLSLTSALDQVRLYSRLNGALPARHRRFGRTLLRTVVPSQRWGIPHVAPQRWAVFFKGGWGSGTGRITSQGARLESARRVWSVAVLTERNPSHAAGVATIERVAGRLMATGPC